MKGKYAIVTGASAGIGRAVAIKLAKEGAFVIMVARRREELLKTYDEIKKAGGRSDPIPADLSNQNSIDALLETIETGYEVIDILVNAAGIWHGENEVYAGRDYETFDMSVILDTFSVGLVAPAILINRLIPLMPKGANIVNISGTFESGAKGWVPYYVSKRGIEDLTIALSEELKVKGINVNCVSPSDTATEEYVKYFPEDAMEANSPQDVADTVLNVIRSGKTSEFIVVKKGKQTKEGFHK